ncbi:MAG: NUDIX hydrolase [Candidatus Paceibacterota bacterium]|jgi:ADP-ribose pyrophosphatase YjhB (NUDIX family)
MEIKSTFTNQANQVLDVIYREANPTNRLEGRIVQGVHAFCFCEGKFVLVYNGEKGSWTPPGGGIEPGETFEEAVTREVKEETNMRVLQQKFIGYQDVFEPTKIVRQTRSVCLVEPFGDFISDPDGDITEIKLIDPSDYKKYFDWGAVGSHLMSKAIKIANSLKKE